MHSRGQNPQPTSKGMVLWAVAAASLLALAVLRSRAAQEPAPSSEVTTSPEAIPAFRLQAERNLVLVRVVVRDSKGRPVGGLQKEDFRLADNGKPQTISHFSVEGPGATPVPLEPQATPEPGLEEGEEEPRVGALPERYLALFFDDVHITFEDLARTRLAAENYLANALQPGDRVGIFTSSGEHQLDFTDDRGKLHATMRGLLPRSIVAQRGRVCPEISGYQAFLIIHRREPYALEIAKEEAKSCDTATQLQLGIPPEALERIVDSVVHSEALRALNDFQTETGYALRALNNLVRGMSALPGERSIVLLSPGFLTLTAEQDVSELVERALRARVLINTLDAKGLAAFIPLGDVSQDPVLPARSAFLVGKKAQFSLDRFNMSTDVLRVLAHDTGGLFFGNSNDLDEGFRRLGTRPTVYYLLAFSPQNLKFDGKLHTLKVSLNTREKYTIQARSGYFAPSQPADAAVQSKEEIEQAVFSRDEVKELPVAVNTQFFKLSDTQAKLSVLTHLDLKLLLFRKENGRNLNNLTFVTALFDRDGKYLAGKEKRVEFRLLDVSLAKLSQSGITARMSFDIPPGTYLIRQVVRDSEGAQLSALNRTVEIPF